MNIIKFMINFFINCLGLLIGWGCGREVGRRIQGKEAPKVMVALNALGKLLGSSLIRQF